MPVTLLQQVPEAPIFLDHIDTANLADNFSFPDRRTCFGRVVKKPKLHGWDYGLLSQAELSFYSAMDELGELSLVAPEVLGLDNPQDELSLVGMAEVGAFDLTSDLKATKFKEAMASANKESWLKAVEEEHNKFSWYKVWELILSNSIPSNAKILSSTWAMQQKANGQFCAQLTACSYKQVDSMHYREDNKAVPVVCNITI